MKTLRIERVEKTHDCRGLKLAPGQFAYAIVIMDEHGVSRFDLPADMAEYAVDYLHGVTDQPQTFTEL